MSLLFWAEFSDYMTPNVTEELFVDTSRSPTIQINLDFIIPRISCDCKTKCVHVGKLCCNFLLVLALDAMDSSGEQHLEINHNIYKRRLDLEGKPIEEPKKEDIIIKVKTNVTTTEAPVCYLPFIILCTHSVLR